MPPNNNDDRRHHRLKVRFLFGAFEADATGAVAMSFVVVLFVLVGGGRWLQLW